MPYMKGDTEKGNGMSQQDFNRRADAILTGLTWFVLGAATVMAIDVIVGLR